MTLKQETVEIALLTVIQLLTPQRGPALVLCDVLDWSAKDAGGIVETLPISRLIAVALTAGTLDWC